MTPYLFRVHQMQGQFNSPGLCFTRYHVYYSQSYASPLMRKSGCKMIFYDANVMCLLTPGSFPESIIQVHSFIHNLWLSKTFWSDCHKKQKNLIPIRYVWHLSAISFCYIYKIKKNKMLKRYLHAHVHYSIVNNSQEVKATQIIL